MSRQFDAALESGVSEQAQSKGSPPAAIDKKSPVWHDLINEVAVDRMSPMPPVEQIQNAIRHQLATGRVPAGSRLPSARTLAAAVGVTAATVGRAYAGLQAEGLLASTIGVGTTVVDLRDLGAAARAQMFRAGEAILEDTIEALRRIGFTTADLRAVLTVAADRLGQSMEVVFIAAQGSSIDSHVVELRRTLKEFPITVTPIYLGDIESGNAAALEYVTRADLIVTTLVYKRHLSTLLGERAKSVHVMMSELAAAVTEELLSIDHDAKILLLSKPLSRSIALGILQSHGLREQLSVAVDLDPESIRSTNAATTVYVHTTDLTDLVAEVAGSAHTIPLRMTLRPESIETLREYLRDAIGRRHQTSNQTSNQSNNQKIPPTSL